MKKLLFLVTVVLAAGAATVTGCQSAQPAASPQQPAEPAKSAEAAQDNSLSYVMDKGEFIIGLDDTFAPMGFRDEGGNLVGFDIDLATAVCEEMGVTPLFQPIDWDAKQMELDGKHIDCIWNGMSITPDRMESMSLTRGYLNNRIVVMTVKGVTVATVEDLARCEIGTQADSSALEVAKAHESYDLFKDKINEYRTYDECIMDMQAGRIQAMIVDEVLGSYKNNALGGSFNVAELNFGDDLYAVGLRKGETALTEKVQASIDALISSGKAGEISEKWFGKDIVVKP